eukprot:1541483-Amphidinium_carterae.1
MDNTHVRKRGQLCVLGEVLMLVLVRLRAGSADQRRVWCREDRVYKTCLVVSLASPKIASTC